MSRSLSSLLFVLAALTLGIQQSLASAGESGMPILKMGLPVRSTALADASVSWVRGASAAWHNPAGIRTEDGSFELMLVHREWIQDARLEFLGASFPLGQGSALGFSLATQTVPDIEIRTRPGAPEGTFTSRTLGVGLSYSHDIADDLRLGATVKFLYEKILIDEASGLGIDAGIQWQTPLPEVAVGLAISNIGGMSTLRNEATSLPSMLRTGASWRTDLSTLGASALLTGDLLYVIPEGAAYGGLGGEVLVPGYRRHPRRISPGFRRAGANCRSRSGLWDFTDRLCLRSHCPGSRQCPFNRGDALALALTNLRVLSRSPRRASQSDANAPPRRCD